MIATRAFADRKRGSKYVECTIWEAKEIRSEVGVEVEVEDVTVRLLPGKRVKVDSCTWLSTQHSNIHCHEKLPSYTLYPRSWF